MRRLAVLVIVLKLCCIVSTDDVAGKPCTFDVQCGEGYECVAGACGYQCLTDADCTQPDHECIYKQCIKVCTSHFDCNDHQQCAHGTCTVQCQDNEGCICPGLRNSICYNATCLRRCADSDDCPGLDCIEGVCRSPASCIRDEQCSLGAKCKNSVCVGACGPNGECPSSHTCDTQTQVCMTKLSSPCPQDGCGCGQSCIAGNCLPQERIDYPCASGTYCGLTAACSISVAGVCSCVKDRQGFCIRPPTVCIPSEYDNCNFVEKGTTCGSDQVCECSDGTVISGQCYKTENNVCDAVGSTCPSGVLCRSGHCYPSCGPNNPCPPGMLCYENVCVIGCDGHEQCDASQLCVNGHCSQTCTGSRARCDVNRQLCDNFKCRTTCSDNKVCGPDAICAVKIGCVHTCSKDEHCLSDYELCVSGTCAQKCEKLSDCAADSECLSGRCYTRCAANRDCTSAQECNVGLCMLTCQESIECSANEVCAYGKCRYMCFEDLDCIPNVQICIAGLCSSRCTTDAPCESGDNCLERFGVYGCIPTCSGSCNEAQFCQDSVCWAIYRSRCTDSKQCAPYSYCLKRADEEDGECQLREKVGRHCTDGVCGFNEVCVNDICECVRINDGDCMGPYAFCPEDGLNSCDIEVTGSLCNDNRNMCECPAGMIQIARTCLPLTVCAEDSDCADGSCVSLHCYPHCSAGVPCLEGFYCVNGLCSLNCTTHAHCDFNQQCIEGRCTTVCHNGDSDPCASHQGCEPITGICKKLCIATTVCKDYAKDEGKCYDGICATVCQTNAECRAGQFCDETGICMPTCSSDKECKLGEHCIAGGCTVLCASNADCQQVMEECKLGMCTATCADDSDCTRTSGRCHSGFCVHMCLERTAKAICGGATCAEGICTASCTQNTQCGPGQCNTTSGGCLLACAANDQCAQGQFCDTDSFCHSFDGKSNCAASGCGSEFYCTPGDICKSLHRPGQPCKTASDDCGPTELCNGLLQCECVKSASGRCVDITTCSSDIHCKALGANGKCDTDIESCVCGDNSHIGTHGICVAEVRGCIEQADCPSGQSCYNLICHPTCTRDNTGVCPRDTKCKNGYCIQACNAEEQCPFNSQSCMQGACVSMCLHTTLVESPCIEGILTQPCGSCDAGWRCENRFCVRLCTDYGDCAANQECDSGVCRCSHKTHLCPGPTKESGLTPKCTMQVDCNALEQCLFGVCQCELGAIRSTNGACVWNLQAVCHNCPSCVGSCSGVNMVCNSKSRLCVCKEGYILDISGTACTEIAGTTTNVPCSHHSDCAAYPSTICSSAVSRCVCRTGFCHEDGHCIPDVNECLDYKACVGNQTCLNTPCRAEPDCVDKIYANGITTFKIDDEQDTCRSSHECGRYQGGKCYSRKCGRTFCYNGKCTCERGSIVVPSGENKWQCQVSRCTKAEECGGLAKCTNSGACVALYLLQEETIKDGGRNIALIAAFGGAGLILLLVLLAVGFLAYRKFMPSKAELQRRYWEKEEARLAAEELELDRMDTEFEEEQKRKKEEYLQRLKDQKEAQEREQAERAEKERLQRLEEERILRERAEEEEANRLRRLQEEKEAKERERKLAKEARLKAEAERKAKAAAEKKQREEEAEAERLRIEEARRIREEEEAARRQAEKEAREEMKRQQEEEERLAREEQEAKRLAMKAEQEARRLALKAEQEAKRLALKAEQAAKRKAEKEAQEELKRQQEEEERRIKAEMEARKLALKKAQEAAKLAREKAIRDKERAARERIQKIKDQTAAELARLAEERAKRLASMVLIAPDADDDEDKAESGWSAAMPSTPSTPPKAKSLSRKASKKTTK